MLRGKTGRRRAFSGKALLGALVVAAWVARALSADLSASVNPFIGTGGDGHCFPAACSPFGLVQAGPDTGWGDWRYCSGYCYEDTHVTMFSQTHNAGGGCPDYGDIGLMPGIVSNAFRHATETARPGLSSAKRVFQTARRASSTHSTCRTVRRSS